MNLARDVKGKRNFYRYVGDQRKTRENIVPLLHDSGRLKSAGDIANPGYLPAFTTLHWLTGALVLKAAQVVRPCKTC